MLGFEMLAKALSLVMIAAPVSADVQKPNDAELTDLAMEQFRIAVEEGRDSLPAAANVCRIRMGQAARGITIVEDAIRAYRGRGKEILPLVCYGYMRAAVDIFERLPPKPSE